ncbi:MAG TPA: HNH endonuclease, partial [Gaiellaceae bacterium]|nr:HNH endonuclease [Gaiellaceae bacterium]
FGEDVPYSGGLDRGFTFRGRRVPYLNRQKGIFRAAVQRGPAALSIQTSANTPYSDVETPEGFLYDYRAGALDQPDNRALRAAHELQVPIVYFLGTRPGWYRANVPFFVINDEPGSKQVLVAPGAMVGPMDEPEPILPDDPIERRYVLREARARIHQARFRGRVVPAYREQCAICRLKEIRLLEAAHIVADVEESGDPVISNGLALCAIHHRAFDHDLVAISPEYKVRVSPRLLRDEDGPMLELLKRFDGEAIYVPRRPEWKPDRHRLEARYERFVERA